MGKPRDHEGPVLVLRQYASAPREVLKLPACHLLPATYLAVPQAGGAFGATRAQVQDGLAPMANPLLEEFVDRVNLHPLSAPAEGAVGQYEQGRVTSDEGRADKNSGER